MNDLIIDDLVPKQKLVLRDKNIDISDYKMVSLEIVKQTDKEIHISTLYRKRGCLNAFESCE